MLSLCYKCNYDKEKKYEYNIPADKSNIKELNEQSFINKRHRNFYDNSIDFYNRNEFQRKLNNINNNQIICNKDKYQYNNIQSFKEDTRKICNSQIQRSVNVFANAANNNFFNKKNDLNLIADLIKNVYNYEQGQNQVQYNGYLLNKNWFDNPYH